MEEMVIGEPFAIDPSLCWPNEAAWASDGSSLGCVSAARVPHRPGHVNAFSINIRNIIMSPPYSRSRMLYRKDYAGSDLKLKVRKDNRTQTTWNVAQNKSKLTRTES